MEVSHSLTLNEAALQQLPEDKRPHFIFEWLRFLDKVLVAAHKSDIKACQEKLVSQLVGLTREPLGPPARRLLARDLATLFTVGDTFLLFDTLNKCIDIIKVKDDSPSYLPTRLAAICCLGELYEKLGRLMGWSYDDTVQTLLRSLKSAESQTRLEIMETLSKICVGMSTAATGPLREVTRAARQSLLSERSFAVRAAAARCLRRALPLLRLTPADLDSVAAPCLRAAHPSDAPLRIAVAELLGSLIAATQAGDADAKSKVGQTVQQAKKAAKSVVSLDEALNVLMGAFLRGGSSFLKGEIIKAGSGVHREVRVCVTHAYVVFIRAMGGAWLERHLATVLGRVLDLVASPKAASSHVDAVYSRQCINYILRNTLGKMLGERAQAAACREIVRVVVKQMTSIDFNPENAKDCNQETLFSQHLLVCALTELGELTLQVGTAAQHLLNDPSLKMIDAICSVLAHPCVAARLAAARALRCVCVAASAHHTPLVDRCIDALDEPAATPHHVSGYSAALAAVLGAVRHSPLGVPHSRAKLAFNAAEQLLRSAGQSSRLTAARTHAGWLVVGAICTQGEPVVRALLPRMLLLWRNSFPRSAKELESERARGDAFTWQVTLEGRAGALAALHSLVTHCPALAADDEYAKRLAQPVDGAVAVLSSLGTTLAQYGGALKAPHALLRLRTYRCARALGVASVPLLRLAAAELAPAAHQATSLMRSALHPRDVILLGDAALVYDTDYADIEEQLVSQTTGHGSSALEHEPCSLYQEGAGALPLGVAVIDAAALLFPLLFLKASMKHRQQMLEHFAECIKMSKGAVAEAIQINVFTALLLAFKAVAEAKGTLGQEPTAAAVALVINGIARKSSAACGAAALAGRLCGIVDEREAQSLHERLLTVARTSKAEKAPAAAAVGSILRARGAASSAASLAVLRSLVTDSAMDVQVWSLHALCVLVEAAGPMFRNHVDSTLTLALKLLFNASPLHEDLHRCIGRLISALITVVGPELQGSTSTLARFTCACAALQLAGGGARAEALPCLQQLHMFAPQHVHLHTLRHTLTHDLLSPELSARRAALSCLRQLSQREPGDVARFTPSERLTPRPYCGVVITDTGLLGALFAYLDMESDEVALSYARDTLSCCLLAPSISEWMTLLKRVLTVKLDDSADGGDEEPDDEQEEYHAEEEEPPHKPVQPRWPTRVFAMECVQKIMSMCEASGEPAHFDPLRAKEKIEADGGGDYLCQHVSELVRVTFVAATAEADALRLAGLAALHDVVRLFAHAREPGFDGQLLLEQYQAQVGAALRPAFAADTAPHVSAAACRVCSACIASPVARDYSDLRRIHQLLLSSLDKLNTTGATLYNESIHTLEKLSILEAWAEVYIVAMVSNGSAPGSYVNRPRGTDSSVEEWRRELEEGDGAAPPAAAAADDSVLRLVAPELAGLARNWLAALRDHALLTLPPEFSSQLPHGGGAFYSGGTARAARAHYARAWPPLLYAATLLPPHVGCPEEADNRTAAADGGEFNDPMDERFHLLFGICTEALCSGRDTSPQRTASVLMSCVALLSAPANRARLLRDRALAIELCQILHRTGLTQASVEALALAADALELVVLGAREQLRAAMDAKIKELAPSLSPSEAPPQSVLQAVLTLGEGGPTGDLPPGRSLVFAALELATCFLVRRFPSLSPNARGPGAAGAAGLGARADPLLATTLRCLAALPDVCSPEGALAIMPTLLYLATSTLRAASSTSATSATSSAGSSTPVVAATLLLRAVATRGPALSDPDTRERCVQLLHSALAGVLQMCGDESGLSGAAGAAALASLLGAARAPQLHYPAINHFRRCLDGPDCELFTATCDILRGLWARLPAPALGWWARALAPPLVARLAGAGPQGTQGAGPQGTQGAGTQEAVLAAGVGALEALVAVSPEDARVLILRLLVPLVTSRVRAADPRDFALHWLARVGPLYPQEFKAMMQQSPELRARLQAAARAPRPRAPRPAPGAAPRPTIQLKTDFSDFR